MLSSAIAGFVLGILGSVHCVGMCGPLIIAIPFQAIESKAKKAIAYLLYGGGKTLAYMMLGLLVGMIGSKAQQLHAQRYVSIVAGVLLLLSVLLPMIFKNKSWSPKFISTFTAWVNKNIAKQFQNQRLYSFGIIGFFNGLLPCGLVYVAIASSASAISLAGSISFMLFFGIATMLSLSVFSIAFQGLSMNVRNQLRKVFPYIIIITALLLIMRGLQLGIPYLSPIFDGSGGPGKDCCAH